MPDATRYHYHFSARHPPQTRCSSRLACRDEWSGRNAPAGSLECRKPSHRGPAGLTIAVASAFVRAPLCATSASAEQRRAGILMVETRNSTEPYDLHSNEGGRSVAGESSPPTCFGRSPPGGPENAMRVTCNGGEPSMGVSTSRGPSGDRNVCAISHAVDTSPLMHGD